jgi:SAM-dependent methyltransferase
MFFESEKTFSRLEDWTSWLDRNPWALQSSYADAVAEDIRRSGLIDPIRGYVRPSDIEIGNNLRESIVAHGINSRQRAVLKLLCDEALPADSVVYASESVTHFAGALRLLFPNFVGSEYLPTLEQRARRPELRHEDVQALTFPDQSVSAYVSCEVIEHIPDISSMLKEAARILRPEGILVATFPFGTVSKETLVKARLTADGSIEFVGAPEYHGNPIDPNGSPVFSIPGWDILQTARRSGFVTADIIASSSRRYGILGGEIVPILVMKARR